MLDTIFARRSIRKYTEEPVTDEQVQKLLKAAMAAPSASNRKPWHYVVIRERSTLKRLAEAHPYGKMLADAALCIAVCGDTAISPKRWDQDCSASTQNILLAATSMGLGSVWLAGYPAEEIDNAVRNILSISERVHVLCLVAVGHPAEQKEPRTQYDAQRVHQEHW